MAEIVTPHTLRVVLEQEVSWGDIAPLLDELQKEFPIAEVRRDTLRVAVGGPGFDIIPTLLLVASSALVIEAVRDLYPKIKQRLYSIYAKLPGVTPTGKVYPMALKVVEPNLEVLYRIPEGLSDSTFAQALNSVPTHFAGLKGRDGASLVFTYELETGDWVENIGASAFQTSMRRQRMEGA